MPHDDLDPAVIRARLAAGREALGVEVLDACTSTNSVLLARAPGPHALLLVAREQTEGRGRRGRRWSSPRGTALTFSLRWHFSTGARALQGLSLAAGVALARALRELGANAVGLKWPNDLLATGPHAGAKLGGVLIETRAAAGGVDAVIGIGLNCRRAPGLEERLRRPIAALEDLLQPLPRRDELAAHLAAGLARDLRAFAAGGLAQFSAEWESLHALRGRRLRVSMGGGRVVSGYADGLAPDGGLQLRTRGGMRTVRDGSVTLARNA